MGFYTQIIIGSDHEILSRFDYKYKSATINTQHAHDLKIKRTDLHRAMMWGYDRTDPFG